METAGRRVVVSEFISLDGVIESPSWTARYWNDDIAAFKRAETTAAEALLLGRVTYEMFVAVWPTSKDEGAPFINALPKHVASTYMSTKRSWHGAPRVWPSRPTRPHRRRCANMPGWWGRRISAPSPTEV